MGADWGTEMKAFRNACVINETHGLNTTCSVKGAEMIARALDGLTEVIYIGYDNEVCETAYFLDGSMEYVIGAGEPWGPELTAIIENN